MKDVRKYFYVALIASIGAPVSAADEGGKRFVEFPDNASTDIYDLDTVQLLQPGRFTVTKTTIDNPEGMRTELKVLGLLRPYCSREEGEYPAPPNLLVAGPPDLAVQKIKIVGSPRKVIWWTFPYANMKEGSNPKPIFLTCAGRQKTEGEAFFEAYSSITNGTVMKELFDCKRGLHGFFWGDENLKDVVVRVVTAGTVEEDWYLRVCYSVTHEAPYVPH